MYVHPFVLFVLVLSSVHSVSLPLGNRMIALFFNETSRCWRRSVMPYGDNELNYRSQRVNLTCLAGISSVTSRASTQSTDTVPIVLTFSIVGAHHGWNAIITLRAANCTAVISFMMTSPNGNIFHVTGHLWGEFAGHRWLPSQRPVMQSFAVFFDLRLNLCSANNPVETPVFETPSCSLWRHCNDLHSYE